MSGRPGIKRTFVAAGAAAVMLTPALALAEQGVTATEVRIGNVLPLSGPPALVGRAAHLGSVVAAREANAAGGVNGRTIRIVSEDDRYIPAQSHQALKKLISDGTFALIGTGGNANLAAMLPVIDENKIPTIVSFSPSSAAVNPLRPYIFMIGADYNAIVYSQLKYIHEKLAKKGATYGMIRQDDDFGVQVEIGFKRAVKEFKLKTIPVIKYKRGQKNFAAEILKVRAQKVDVLVAGGVISETVSMLREASKYRMKLQIATVPTSTLPIVIKLSKKTGYRYLSADYVAPMGSAGTAHFEKMAAKHLTAKEVGALNRYALTAYVATKVMIEAIRRCGKAVTRACVIGKLASGEEYETKGVTPPVKFGNGNHVSATALRVLGVDAGKGKVTELTDFKVY